MKTTLRTALVTLVILFTLANGWIHLTEWLDVYRDLPSQVPGAEVVKIGFPVNVAVSVALAAALGFSLLRPRFLRWAALATLGFQIGSLAALIVSRTGSLFGWQEPVWNDAANQTRAVEIAAIVLLGALLALTFTDDEPAGAPSRA